ncbi:hypothetical protein D3C72_1601560 [compost metagenome]
MFGHHRAGRHSHPAAGLATLLGELALQLVERTGDAAAVVQKGQPLGRGREAVGRAVQQPCAASLLDARQGAGDLAHRRIALARYRRERAQIGHAHEQVHVFKADIAHRAMVTAGGRGASARIVALDARTGPLQSVQNGLAAQAVSAVPGAAYSGFTLKGNEHVPTAPAPR